MILPAASPGWILASALAIAVFAGASELGRALLGGTRQLWRAGATLAVAAGSFVLAQQKLLPALLRGSPLQYLPIFLPLAVMLFWLVRLRLGKAFRNLRNTPVIQTNLKAA